jgi:hypothetical protein
MMQKAPIEVIRPVLTAKAAYLTLILACSPVNNGLLEDGEMSHVCHGWQEFTAD